MGIDREKLNEFNDRLNEDPLLDIDTATGKPRYIKKRSVGGGKEAMYIVHSRRDHLLNMFFDFHEFKITSTEILTKQRKDRLVSEYIVVLELNVLHPILNQIVSYIGIGSASDNGVLAMQSVSPAALAYAMSNASKKIGRVFGAYLNKKEDEVFVDISDEDKTAALKGILSVTYNTINELENAVQADSNEFLTNSPELLSMYNAARDKIKVKLVMKAAYEKFMTEKMPELEKKINSATDRDALTVIFNSLRKREQNWSVAKFSEKGKTFAV